MTEFIERTKVYFTKPYLKRYFLYLFGISLLSLGVALIYQTFFGAAAWDALHMNFHVGIPLSFAYIYPISSAILVCIAYLIEWKKPDWQMVLPIILSLIFGSMVDVFELNIPNVEHGFFLWNILYFCGAISVIGIGLNIIRYCKFGLPGIDQFCLAMANRLHLTFGQGKFLGEVIATIATVIVGLMYGTRWIPDHFYLGFTTVFFILFLGAIIDLFRNQVFRVLKGIPKMDLYADDLTEADINTENVVISSSAIIESDGKIMILYLKDKDYYILPKAQKLENERIEKSLRREVLAMTGRKINLHEEELILNEYEINSSSEFHYFRAKLRNKKIFSELIEATNVDVLWLEKNELIDILSNHDTKDKFGPQIMWREFLVIVNTI